MSTSTTPTSKRSRLDSSSFQLSNHRDTAAPLSPAAFCKQLFLLHDAILCTVDRLVSAVDTLTPLASDISLDELRLRISHLRETLLAHCKVEDTTIFPLLQSALISSDRPTSHQELSQTEATTPADGHLDSSQLNNIASDAAVAPSSPKRPRRASPISVNLRILSRDHNHTDLPHACDVLQRALARLRATPMTRHELPGWTSDQSHSPSPSSSISSIQSPSAMDDAPCRAKSRVDAIVGAQNAAAKLQSVVRAHFNSEEIQVAPAYVKLLSASQQASLLVHVARAVVADRRLVNTFRFVADRDLLDLFNAVSIHDGEDDVKLIAVGICQVLPAQRWALLCENVPLLTHIVVPKHDPLIPILHMHKAMVRELHQIVSYCDSLDPFHFKQMRTLFNKVQFLRRIQSFHAKAEEGAVFKPLHARMKATSCAIPSLMLCDEHGDGEEMFSQFTNNLNELEVKATRLDSGEQSTHTLKQELSRSVHNIASHLTDHMDQEESIVLPLVRKYFCVKEQEEMMRDFMAMVPSSMFCEIIPWMFNALDVNEKESMIRNLLRSSQDSGIRRVIRSIAESVVKGETERAEWNEICLRIPEIEEEYQIVADKEEDDSGPVSEILRVHKALRIELNVLLRRCKEIAADGTFPNPKDLVSLAQGVAFLRRMVLDHSQAEDDIILPLLDKRVPGISETYHDDHCDERKLFQDLAQCLQDLQCVSDETECTRLVIKLHGLAETLRDDMVSHLKREEKDMWPVLKQHFSLEEQSEVVALIFGQMPANRLRELLPWMIRSLSVSEGNIMMNHILEVTRSTMFETWLKTWLPLSEDKSTEAADDQNKDMLQAKGRSSLEDAKRQGAASSSNAGQTSGDFRLSETSRTEGDGRSAALAYLNGKETMECTIRAIARDASLSVEERTRMMQQVMLAPYSETRARGTDNNRNITSLAEDRIPTFHLSQDGVQHLGCRHYLRACKMRAACCGKLYTCRLCHDDAEQTHIMDRYATKEILCMRCDTLQPVSLKCGNEKCGQLFAKYFCEVCNFFDDREERSIYHCPSCNVCRAGKGLGIDFFHCMKCNQCMSMKYRKKGHRCVERAMESDCPVCHQYLFTSTEPVKYLKCGHLMHNSCHEEYIKRYLRCPVCSRSLEEMASVFQRIDHLMGASSRMAMPAEYRALRCNLYCLDCYGRSDTSYHFVYNKCPVCSSYNTRVEHIITGEDERPAQDTGSGHRSECRDFQGGTN